MKDEDLQREIISEVENYLGASISGSENPPQGMDSEVFFATDANGRGYAIKYGRNAAGDVLAYKLLRENKAEIPVPQIYGSFEQGGKAVVILEKMKYPLLEEIPVEEMHRYIPSMIENLKKIHAIKSNRAGLLQAETNKNWKELLLSKFDGTDENLDWSKIARRKGLDTDLVQRSVESIAKKIEKTEFIENDYSFLHTDFNQRNLFVDPESDKITGIIDWTDAMFGDPVYDFARIRMYIWHFDLGERVLGDYYRLVSFTPEQKQLEELYWLVRIVEYLAYYSEELNDFNVGRIKLHQDFLRQYHWKL